MRLLRGDTLRGRTTAAVPRQRHAGRRHRLDSARRHRAGRGAAGRRGDDRPLRAPCLERRNPHHAALRRTGPLRGRQPLVRQLHRPPRPLGGARTRGPRGAALPHHGRGADHRRGRARIHRQPPETPRPEGRGGGAALATRQQERPRGGERGGAAHPTARGQAHAPADRTGNPLPR